MSLPQAHICFVHAVATLPRRHCMWLPKRACECREAVQTCSYARWLKLRVHEELNSTGASPTFFAQSKGAPSPSQPRGPRGKAKPSQGQSESRRRSRKLHGHLLYITTTWFTLEGREKRGGRVCTSNNPVRQADMRLSRPMDEGVSWSDRCAWHGAILPTTAAAGRARCKTALRVRVRSTTVRTRRQALDSAASRSMGFEALVGRDLGSGRVVSSLDHHRQGRTSADPREAVA